MQDLIHVLRLMTALDRNSS